MENTTTFTPENDIPKRNFAWELRYQVKEGYIVKLINGQTAEFVRIKQKKFIGIMDGKKFDIPIEWYAGILEKKTTSISEEERVKKCLAELEETQGFDYHNLVKGELFYINKKENALLFIFDKIIGNKVIGISPISKIPNKIDTSFTFTRVCDIK